MISIKNLTKVYPTTSIAALDDVSLEIADGSAFGVIGVSGAGKSTLARCINLLERPTSGRVVVDGEDVTDLAGPALRRHRQRVAMIFQGFGLLAQKTALDNVCFPFRSATGRVTAQDRDRARDLLARVGLADKERSYPAQLSGGQKQRVAIARALASSPDYLLCDEATSALDPASTEAVLEVLDEVKRELGVTLVVITHTMDVVRALCDDVAVLDAGHVVEHGPVARVFASPQATVTRALLGEVSWHG